MTWAAQAGVISESSTMTTCRRAPPVSGEKGGMRVKFLSVAFANRVALILSRRMSIALENSANPAETKSANPVRAEPDWPPVVVGGAFQTGVVLMRDLSRRGLRGYAFDCVPEQPGF